MQGLISEFSVLELIPGKEGKEKTDGGGSRIAATVPLGGKANQGMKENQEKIETHPRCGTFATEEEEEKKKGPRSRDSLVRDQVLRNS